MNAREQEKVGKRKQATIDRLAAQGVPHAIVALVANGILRQGRKRTYQFCFFVHSVEKGQIIWDEILQTLLASHHQEIPNQEQYARFHDVFNGLLAQLMAQQGERHEC